jgi:hypothetical protein
MRAEGGGRMSERDRDWRKDTYGNTVTWTNQVTGERYELCVSGLDGRLSDVKVVHTDSTSAPVWRPTDTPVGGCLYRDSDYPVPEDLVAKMKIIPGGKYVRKAKPENLYDEIQQKIEKENSTLASQYAQTFKTFKVTMKCENCRILFLQDFSYGTLIDPETEYWCAHCGCYKAHTK